MPEASVPLGPAWGGVLLALLGLIGTMGLWRWRQGRSAAPVGLAGQVAQQSPRKALLAGPRRGRPGRRLCRAPALAGKPGRPGSPGGRERSAVGKPLESLGSERYGPSPTDQPPPWAELKSLAGKLSGKEQTPSAAAHPALYPS